MRRADGRRRSDGLRPAHAGHFAAELKCLAAAIGEARDWDVFVTRTLPALLGDFGDPRLAGKILALAMQRRAHARAAARVALASSRAALLVMNGSSARFKTSDVIPQPLSATVTVIRLRVPSSSTHIFTTEAPALSEF